MCVIIYICQHHLLLSSDWPIDASILGHASYILSECLNCLLQPSHRGVFCNLKSDLSNLQNGARDLIFFSIPYLTL